MRTLSLLTDLTPLLIVALGVVALLILIMKLNLNTFISLIVVSFLVAIALRMPIEAIVESIEAGMGDTLGSIALFFGFGAILGRLVSDAGGAQRIAMTLIDKLAEKHIQWAAVLASYTLAVARLFEFAMLLSM